MSFTNEQILKAKAAKSAEELLALAKENGVELSEEEAAKYFTEWHKEGELSDDELDNVVGGCDDTVLVGSKWFEFWCPFCGELNHITVNFYTNGDSNWKGQDKEYCTCGAHITVYHASFNATYSKGGKNVDVNAYKHS